MILAAAAHTRHSGVACRFRGGSLEDGSAAQREPSSRFWGLRMATILEFKSAPRQPAASMRSAFGTAPSAEIVFFPGVRYERQGEDGDAQRALPNHRREEPELES